MSETTTKNEDPMIRIGASDTAMNVFLLDILSRYHEQHPAVRLMLTNCSSQRARRDLAEGKVDIAVVTTPAAEAVPPFVKVECNPFAEVLVGGNAYEDLRIRRAMSLKDLQNYPLICHAPGTVAYEFLAAQFHKKNLEFHPDTTSVTTDQILSLVSHNLGLAFLPEPFVKEPLSRGDVVRIPLAADIPLRYICLIYNPETVKTGPMKDFMDLARLFVEK